MLYMMDDSGNFFPTANCASGWYIQRAKCMCVCPDTRSEPRT